jgi:flagellar motor switch protein FliN/FliY
MGEQEESTQAPPASGEEQVSAPPSAAPPAASRPSSGPTSGPSSAAPLLMGVKLPIRVLLGRTELCLRDIAQLGNGAVVELDCSPDDPVEIIVNDRVIAHGEVVVVAGNYGVRITKIASRGQSPEAERAEADLFTFSEKLR